MISAKTALSLPLYGLLLALIMTQILRFINFNTTIRSTVLRPSTSIPSIHKTSSFATTSSSLSDRREVQNIEMSSSTAFPQDRPQDQEKQQTQDSQQQEDNESNKIPLGLPEPPSADAPHKLDVSTGEGVSLDALGPMVVNKDGTISRISNWDKMAPIEKANTLRIVGKRNQVRLEALRKEEEEEGKAQE
jgi:hypothetical protein